MNERWSRRFLLGTLFAAAAVVTVPAAPSRPSPDARSASAGNLDRTDRRFVETAAEDGRTDVALTTLATDRAGSPQVRAIADRLGLDSTNLSLAAAALAEATDLPLENDLAGNRLYRRLANDGRARFDQHFLEAMATRTQREVDRFSREAHVAQDPRIREFATHQVATLRDDLTAVRQMRRALRD